MRSKRLKTEPKVASSDGSQNKSIDCSDDCVIINTLNNGSNEETTNGDHNSNKQNSQTNGTNFAYTPKLCLRCHCKSNDPFDNSTPIWGASFQPKTKESDGNGIVATCGANMVCIIDCLHSTKRTGRSVIARYIDDDPNEEFVSICWSTISLSAQNMDTSETLVLAVGGKKNILLLSNLNRFHSYERVSAHSDQINSLVFTQNDLLFSASYDMTVKLWRISRPYDKSLTQLLKTIDTKHNLLSLCFSNKHQMLMASGGKGLTFWANPLDFGDTIKPIISQMKTKYLVDGLHLIPEEEDLIAIRIHSSKCLSIIDLKKVLAETHNTDNKSKIKSILFSKVLKTKLRSFESDYPYIYLSAQNNLLVSGGPNGQIWLYDTKHLSQSGPNQIVAEDKVIGWPIIENIEKDNKEVVTYSKPFGPIINTVAISPDLKFLIACTSMNLILILCKP